MSSTKLRLVAYDVLTDLKQAFSNREIQLAQVVYWTTIVGNKLLGQHIQKRDSGSFLTIFDAIPVQEDAAFFGRKYVMLPSSIFDFNKDRGIDYIAYTSDGQDGCAPRFTRTTFNRTTTKISHRLYLSGYETPAPTQPYFYLTRERIWFLGIERVDVPFLEIGAYLHLPPVNDVALDDDFAFPDELIPQLKREVIDIGRFALLMPADRVEDGTSDPEGKVPTQKISSVNQPVQQQQVDEQQ